MRSCALVYRGRWLGVKGRARNCAWGRHVLLVVARRIAIPSAARAERATYRSTRSSENLKNAERCGHRRPNARH
jgi:hypothetical protein